jgi:hypothetical protein
VQLREAYQEALLLAADSGQSLPSNLPDGRHHLDRLILELFCAMSVNRAGRSVQTIRGCFPEGEPAFPGSRILERTHVQLSVRDLSCIKSVSLVTWGQEARGLRGGPVDGAQE